VVDGGNNTVREIEDATSGGLISGQPSSAVGLLRGDMNADGVANIQDAILALQSSVGLISLTPAQQQAGDVNGDGEVNVADAVKILRVAVGLDHF
jgi:hypothetical protein